MNYCPTADFVSFHLRNLVSRSAQMPDKQKDKWRNTPTEKRKYKRNHLLKALTTCSFTFTEFAVDSDKPMTDQSVPGR